MIISRRYAKRLIRLGRARYAGSVTDRGQEYMIVVRLDKQRTDHHLA